MTTYPEPTLIFENPELTVRAFSVSEMDNIVNELFACDNVNYTPSGEPVIAIMKQQDIEHLFDR